MTEFKRSSAGNTISPALLAILGLLLAAAADLACPRHVDATGQTGTEFTLARGWVNASEHELDECYMNVGHGQDAAMVGAHPANMVCKRFAELAAVKPGIEGWKTYGRLVFIVEEPNR